MLALLNDEEWREWSNREIARRCAVVPGYVNNIRETLSGHGIQIDDSTPRIATRNGTTYTQQTANIGKSRKQQPEASTGDAVASTATRGVAIETPSDAVPDVLPAELYKATHNTFADYCRDRWGLSRPRAYELLKASAVVRNLSAIADITPNNEAQARPLTVLEPDEQRAAWAAAVDRSGGKVTGQHVANVVRDLFPRELPAQPEEAADEGGNTSARLRT